jgi:signal transduction histidine kinase
MPGFVTLSMGSTPSSGRAIRNKDLHDCVLPSSLDYETSLDRVIRLVAPAVADSCAVDLVQPGLPPRRIVAHADPRRLDRRRPRPAGHAARIRPMLRPNSIVVPIAIRRQTLGVLRLTIDSSGRRFTQGDLRLARELAHRCAHAIENAQLYRRTQQAVRVRDEFLAATSHELRTPLHHIKAFVSSLRLADIEWDEATRQDFLTEIEREADRLGRLIADLLDLSRLESGGTIRIVTRMAGQNIDIVVEDDGPGIAAEHLESIFEKFFRVRNPMQPSIPGTGLGLAICRAAVEAHGWPYLGGESCRRRGEVRGQITSCTRGIHIYPTAKIAKAVQAQSG